MPHFDKLNDQLEQFLLWADLRHEQGSRVNAAVERVRKVIAGATRELANTAPPERMRRREPNAFSQIRALRPDGPRRLLSHPNVGSLRKRMLGAWLGRAAGCMLGVPVEGWRVADMEALAGRTGMAFPPQTYWKEHPRPDDIRYGVSRVNDYLEGRIKAIEVDDDLAYTLLGLLILERYGTGFSTTSVAEAWLDLLPMACTAEHVALENLKMGVPPSRSALKNNPFMEWIGADIRSDPWGYAAAGWPEQAADWAYRDAFLSHRHNGIYGEMFFAAAIAAAFAVESPMEALRIGLSEIPRQCRLAIDVRWAIQQCPKLSDWRQARTLVDQRFSGMNWVHTNNNACLTVFGLHLGDGDFTRTIGTTVAMGLDNDCTAATAGSIFGAVFGIDRIPQYWWKPFKGRVRTYLRGHETFKINDIVRRFLDQMQALHLQPRQ